MYGSCRLIVILKRHDFKGNNDIKWNGKANNGALKGTNLLPAGTYFYVLHLNSRNLDPKTGWVYLNY